MAVSNYLVNHYVKTLLLFTVCMLTAQAFPSQSPDPTPTDTGDLKSNIKSGEFSVDLDEEDRANGLMDLATFIKWAFVTDPPAETDLNQTTTETAPAPKQVPIEIHIKFITESPAKVVDNQNVETETQPELSEVPEEAAEEVLPTSTSEPTLIAPTSPSTLSIVIPHSPEELEVEKLQKPQKEIVYVIRRQPSGTLTGIIAEALGLVSNTIRVVGVNVLGGLIIGNNGALISRFNASSMLSLM